MKKADILTLVQALVAGTQKHTPNGQFTLGGVAYTAASLAQLFQGLSAAITDANAKQASAKTAVSAMNASMASVGPVIQAYTHTLQETYGTDTETLADYGIEPRKSPTPLTTEQKSAAVAKAEATRKARGTTGKKAKLAIKGNVTGVEVTPVTAPANAAAPAAQPASTTKS